MFQKKPSFVLVGYSRVQNFRMTSVNILQTGDELWKIVSEMKEVH